MTTKSRYINTITLSLIALSFTSGSLLISSNSSASDSSVDNVSITIPVTCTMVGTGINSHTATIENGTYRGDDVNGIGIGETTLKAYCNDTSGFSIYAIGYTNEEYGNTVLKSTTLGDTYNIITGTNTGPVGTEDISNWSMKLKAVSGTYTPTIENGYSNYSNVPTTYTKVATKSSSTDMGSNAEGSSIKSTYAAYISKTQPSDTYEGKVKYTLVHPASEEPPHEVACEAGKICYNPNTTTALGEMGKQSLLQHDWSSCNTYTDYASICVIDGHEIDINTLPVKDNEFVDSAVLYAGNYKRDGYGFAGWNTKYDYTGTNYGPNQDITTPADISTNGVSLYAMWIPSQGILQNWKGCSSMNIGDVIALTDNRDNDTYAVAKLADGKCWIIENLRLDDSAELSSANTHNPSLPLTNIYDSSVTSNHLSPTSSTAYNATTAPEGWCSPSAFSCNNNQSRLRTDNTTLFTQNTLSNYEPKSNVYSYGNYYNWYSATAGRGTDEVHGKIYASGDICPAGWHLPKGGEKSNEDDNEFWQLIVVGLNNDIKPANYSRNEPAYYSGTTETGPVYGAMRSYPNNFVISGSVTSDFISNRLNQGHYWTSYTSVRDSAYAVRMTGADLYPGNSGDYRYRGLSVRCIADV